MTTIHYHAGHNMPGYLPESDVCTFETFEDAAKCIRDELVFSADTVNNIGPKRWAWIYSAAYDGLNTAHGPEWGDTVDGIAYWITPCTEDCEEEGE